MKNANKKQVLALLMHYNELVTFPKKFDNPITQRAWLKALEDYSHKAIGDALETLCIGDNFPTIEAIREAIFSLKMELPEAEETFSWVWTHLNGYEKPDLDPILESTIQKLGGWFHICETWLDYNKERIEKSFIAAHNLSKQEFMKDRNNLPDELRAIGGNILISE